jgi:L-ribulose-5-phosphate 3-epimerase
MRLGIMQGRLSPPEGDRLQAFPRHRWASEFELAAAAGLDSIEWIYDSYGEDVNPVSDDNGVREMRELAVEHAVAVRSLCADWLMEHPPFGEAQEAWVQRLVWLIARSGRAGIKRIVLPFVDAAAPSDAARLRDLVTAVGRALDDAERVGVELHLETSLAPLPFAELLGRLDHPLIWANYDSGNSAALGYDPREELTAYGARIGSLHVKDRVRDGGSVPLGSGDARLELVFRLLDQLGYRGDAILQTARGEPGHELQWVTENIARVRAQCAGAV